MDRTGVEQWKPREVARLLALVETERRYYQEMVEVLPVALAVLSAERTILSSNRAFRLLVGLSGEDLRSRSIEQILPSHELIERIRSAHVHADVGGFWIGTGDRHFRIAAIPIRGWDEDLNAETLLMVEPQEAAPVDQVGPLTSSTPPAAPQPDVPPEPEPQPFVPPAVDFAAVPAAVWQADAGSFIFTYAGGNVEELLGYPAEYCVAEPHHFSERIYAPDRDAVMELYRRVADTGGEASAEFRTLTPSGGIKWVRETIRVPPPGAGEVRLWGVTVAIAQRRTLETLSLGAGRVDALRGLSARLAHDLNNPLTIVAGYTEEILASLSENDTRRGDLAEVLTAARRMQELTGNLLAFARMQAKPATMLAMSEVLAGLESRLRALTREVEFSFPGGSVWTFADAGQLEEAVAAMAALAVESTSDVTRLTVTCRLELVAELVAARTEAGALPPGPYARLDLHAEGHGSGSPHAAFETILAGKEPPKHAAEATRGYLNIRQWGGYAAFDSDPVHGSTFTIYLPFAEPPYTEPAPLPQDAQEPEAETNPQEPPPQEPEEERFRGTILLVEDEPGIRGLVRKILRRERYEVLEVGTGEEALALAAVHEDEIDLLLTDVMLPGMSGRELAETLSASHPGIRVVYVSGFTGDEEVRAGEFPPGSRFLQKPFTLTALVGSVKEAIGE